MKNSENTESGRTSGESRLKDQDSKFRVQGSKFISRKLRSLGRMLVLTEFSRRLALALAGAIFLLGGIMIADGLIELPLQHRKTLLIIAAAMSGILLLRALISLVSHRRDLEEVALLTEQQYPEFDSRLISAVQSGSGKTSGGSGSLHAMVADTESIARRTNFLSTVDPKGFARTALVLLAIAALATAGFFAFQKISPTLLERAFLADIPIPRDTQILSTTGDLRIGIGDQIELSATASGVLPSEGTLRVTFESGRELDYTLTKTENRYLTTIEDVPESFSYRLRINDARSEVFKAEAFARPEVRSLRGTQTYPDYTGIAASEHVPGDFYLFPGSQFQLKLGATKQLAAATLRLIGLEKEIPFDVDTQTASFEVPTEGISGFSITMCDEDGMESKQPAVYRAELLGDEPPAVRITYPTRNDEVVTKTARSLIAFEATDRFGIARVHLNFQINNTDVRSEQLDIGSGDIPPTSLKHQYDWNLGDITPPLKEGDTVSYWISAQDRQLLTPGVGESERRTLRIVSIAEKRQELLRRANDYIGGIGVTTDEQEKLNTDLGDLIRAKQ